MIEQISLFQNNFYQDYVDANHTSDEELCEFIDYLTFKCWLYVNFPLFEGREANTNEWRLVNKDKTISIHLGYTYIDTNKQFISVGFEVKGISGWSSCCDTLGEVKDALNRALKDLERR